jgi:hypothetical protein
MASSIHSVSSDSGKRLNRRTAVCGPACTVVWEGESRKAPPHPDPKADGAPESAHEREGESPFWSNVH